MLVALEDRLWSLDQWTDGRLLLYGVRTTSLHAPPSPGNWAHFPEHSTSATTMATNEWISKAEDVADKVTGGSDYCSALRGVLVASVFSVQ